MRPFVYGFHGGYGLRTRRSGGTVLPAFPLRKRRHQADSTRPRTASVVLAVGLYFASARPPRQLGVDVYDYCEYL